MFYHIILSYFGETLYLISESAGFTSQIRNAGRFTSDDAHRICKPAWNIAAAT